MREIRLRQGEPEEAQDEASRPARSKSSPLPTGGVSLLLIFDIKIDPTIVISLLLRGRVVRSIIVVMLFCGIIGGYSAGHYSYSLGRSRIIASNRIYSDLLGRHNSCSRAT